MVDFDVGLDVHAVAVDELIDRRDALRTDLSIIESEISTATARQRAGMIDQIKGLMAGHDITAADLGWEPAGYAGPANGKALRKQSASKGRKRGPAPIKYRDADGNTWTGRGRQPNWLTAALNFGGATLTDFLVSPAV